MTVSSKKAMDAPLSQVMTRDVEAVGPGASLRTVRDLFAERDLHHVAVVDGERLVGLVSSNDLLRLGDAGTGGRLSARDVMQARPVTVREDVSVGEAAALLSEGAFHGLPVVDAQGRLRGIVTSTDLIRFFADALS